MTLIVAYYVRGSACRFEIASSTDFAFGIHDGYPYFSNIFARLRRYNGRLSNYYSSSFMLISEGNVHSCHFRSLLQFVLIHGRILHVQRQVERSGLTVQRRLCRR